MNAAKNRKVDLMEVERDLRHTARATMKRFITNVSELPSHSQKLSLIENLWKDLKTKITQRWSASNLTQLVLFRKEE